MERTEPGARSTTTVHGRMNNTQRMETKEGGTGHGGGALCRVEQAQEVQDRPQNPRAEKSPTVGRAGQETSPSLARALQDLCSRTR